MGRIKAEASARETAKAPSDSDRITGRAALRASSGQSTVEAAFIIPVFFLLVLLLVQPAIVLYDRLVMASAANEACRLLATADESTARAFVQRRLGAVPPHDLFHVHGGSCSWTIEMEGGGSSQTAKVRIVNELAPLPLVDYGCAFLGLLNEEGHMALSVEATRTVRADWAQQALGGAAPESVIGAWEDD